MTLILMPLLLALAADAPTPVGPTDPEILRAKAQLEALDPEGALRTLEQARVRLQDSPQALAEVYLYIGLAHASLAEDEQARASFRTARLLWPDVPLPADVPPKVRGWWDETARRPAAPATEPPRQTAEVPRVETVPAPAPPVTNTQPAWAPTGAIEEHASSAARPRWRTWTAVSLLGASSLALGASFFVARDIGPLAEQARAEPHIGPASALVARAESRALWSNVLLASGAALATGAGLVFVLGADDDEPVPAP